MDHNADTPPRSRALALKIAIVYWIVGTLWILFSDETARALARDPGLLTKIQMYKGWLYVFATGILLYALIRRFGARLEQALGRLTESETRFRQVVDTAPDILHTLEPGNLETLFISPAVTTLLGFSPADFITDPLLWQRQLHAEDRDYVLASIADQIQSQREFVVEHRMHHRDGATVKWFRHRGKTSALGADGTGLITTAMSDITDQKLAEEQVTYLTNYDPLTGLINQRAVVAVLQNLLQTAETRQHEVCCICFGIDQFLQLNSVYGRHVGDNVLASLARRLTDVMEDGHASPLFKNAVVARSGGDRFLVVLPEFSATTGERIADHLLQQLNTMKLMAEGHQLTITLRAGLITFPYHGRDAGTLLARGERALEIARNFGSSVHLFDASRHQRDTAAAHCMERIHAALEHDWISVDYQPILNLHTRTVDHYEALVRIAPPSEEKILPAKFIEIAERFGIVDRIDRRVLEIVLEQLDQLSAQGIAPSVSVNLSGAHIGNRRLLTWLESRFHGARVRPQQLTFEITETAAIRDLHGARHFMEAVKALGARFALDDFGIGFTSFEHLRSLPLDIVKIDGSFVRAMDKSESDAALVQAIAQVAKAYGKTVIAEFVESEEILEMLQNYDVDYAQGFHIGRPAPLTADDFIRAHRQAQVAAS
jgi:diguanylate cyclase (GGDEF)-like protein/PAS domain S-box-containing protein